MHTNTGTAAMGVVFDDICESAISLSGSTCPEDGLYELITLITAPSRWETLAGTSFISQTMTYPGPYGTTFSCTTTPMITTPMKISKRGYTSTAYAALVLFPIAGLTIASSIYRHYKVKTHQSLDLDGNVEAVGTSNFVGIA
jgi:hypothetical protein